MHTPRFDDASDATRGSVVATLALLLAACGDTPLQPAAEKAGADAFIAAPEAAAVVLALEDARSRILPALAGIVPAAELDHALDDITAALIARNPTAVAFALTDAEAALRLLSGDDAAAAAAADLAAVRLVVAALGPLTEPTRTGER